MVDTLKITLKALGNFSQITAHYCLLLHITFFLIQVKLYGEEGFADNILDVDGRCRYEMHHRQQLLVTVHTCNPSLDHQFKGFGLVRRPFAPLQSLPCQTFCCHQL